MKNPIQTIQAIVKTLVLALILSSCGAATSTSPATVVVSSAAGLTLTSSAFQANGTIPNRFSCHGENLSPVLDWGNAPTGTKSFALIMDDPDAVKVAGHVWDHWLLFNIPATSSTINEGVAATAELPDGSRHGHNSFGAFGYGGPCPPNGQTHGYHFRLYALDTVLTIKAGANKADLLKAFDQHILAQAELIGNYKAP